MCRCASSAENFARADGQQVVIRLALATEKLQRFVAFVRLNLAFAGVAVANSTTIRNANTFAVLLMRFHLKMSSPIR